MHQLSIYIGCFLIVIGVLFNFFGCLGLIRLPDVYNRLQAATKCVTLGTCCMLLSLLFLFGWDNIAIKALIAIPLLFLTSTVSAHALVRGAYKSGISLCDKTVVDHYKEDIVFTHSDTEDGKGRDDEIGDDNI